MYFTDVPPPFELILHLRKARIIQESLHQATADTWSAGRDDGSGDALQNHGERLREQRKERPDRHREKADSMSSACARLRPAVVLCEAPPHVRRTPLAAQHSY